jgi:hypothetical protein
MRKCIFKKLFTEKEKIAIINALFRRAEDNSAIKILCHNLAMELST